MTGKRYSTVVRGVGVAAIRQREQRRIVRDVKVKSLGLDVETGQEHFQISWAEAKRA